MCLRAVMMAARSGGGDPEFNFALRTAIDEAKYHNVPKDNLERAIKKGAGGGEGESYEQGRYEGYGPGGVALIIDALTNNRTRTAADVRLILSKYGGNLGATGCVAFSFETKGRIVVSAPASAEETLFEVAAGAGADDIQFEDDDESPSFTVFTPVQAFNAVKQAIEQANLNITEARIEPIPTTTSAVSGDNAKQLLELVDALEDNDDIQKVYTNAEISDDVLAQM
jgi:YebC/PmpR family DNA-binding regulatory protein